MQEERKRFPLNHLSDVRFYNIFYSSNIYYSYAMPHCNATTVYTETINPVAVYDAEHWMAVGGMAVNISLIEQTLGDIHHAYWLRIGVMFDDDLREHASTTHPNTQPNLESDAVLHSGGGASTPLAIDTASRDAENVVEEEGQLYTIAVLSSDVGKLMVPGADDWVDLSAVGRHFVNFYNLLMK